MLPAVGLFVNLSGALSRRLASTSRARSASSSDPDSPYGISALEIMERDRKSMIARIRTDPTVARDTVIFVDRWHRELGRIINLGSGSPSVIGGGADAKP